VQHHAATFFAPVEAATGTGLPKFVKDEFDAFLECGEKLRPGAPSLTLEFNAQSFSPP
jgi:hypothetical protein